MLCNICSSPVTLLGVATVLKQQQQIQYFRCVHCGFIQTEKPFWLSEAYLETITRSDIGLVRRNIEFSNMTVVIISAFFSSRSRFLDYRGGNGMFVRQIRDKGFDFFWQDRYTINQLARGFESQNIDGYNLVTAFEVIEHLEDPINEVKRMLSYSNMFLFSIMLIPANYPLPGDWWYYALDSGQHISIYSKQLLKELTKKFNLRLYSNGKSVHLLTRKKLPKILFILFSIGQLADLFNLFFSLGKRSLLENDYFHITGKKLK